jgi:hypothetical protein
MSAALLKRYTYNLPPELDALLGEWAEEQDRSKSGVLRQLIMQARSPNPAAGALRPAADTGGCHLHPTGATGGTYQAISPVAVPSSNAAAPHPAAGAPGSVPGIAGPGAALQDPVAATRELHEQHLRRHLRVKIEQEAAQRQAKRNILKSLIEE